MKINKMIEKIEIINTAKKQTEKLYSDFEYRNNILNKINWINEISHFWFEKTAPKIKDGSEILELGASSTINIKYCKKNYNSYTLSEKDTSILNVLENKGDLKQFNNYKILTLDAMDISSVIKQKKFDRIIACNLLEHLKNPEIQLINWYEAVKPGGILSLLQPCDPGILWRIGRNLGHRQSCISKGLNYDLIMALEHINSANNLITISRQLFPKEARINYFPFILKSWNLNLFYAIHIKKVM